jgi:hypothetical protein
MAGRPLQRQGLLGGQPTKPQAQQVAALPASHYRVGGRLRVDPDLAPGVGRPGAQLNGEIGQEHQLTRRPVGVASHKLVQQGAVRLGDPGVQQGSRRHHQHCAREPVTGWVQ